MTAREGVIKLVSEHTQGSVSRHINGSGTWESGARVTSRITARPDTRSMRKVGPPWGFKSPRMLSTGPEQGK